MKGKSGFHFGKRRRKSVQKRKYQLIYPIIGLVLCGIVVLMERYGIRLRSAENISFEQEYTKQIDTATECLVLYQSENATSELVRDQLDHVLDGMKLGYKQMEGDKLTQSDLSGIRTAIIATPDWTTFDEEIFTLFDWVEKGGHLLVACAPDCSNIFSACAQKIGIIEGGNSYTSINGFRILNNSMIGAENDAVFPLVETTRDSVGGILSCQLSSDCAKIVESKDGRVPILWKMDLGKGRISVLNDAIDAKFQRGFLLTAYSMLDDLCIYPVINSSVYYLDDFPSPVPQGDSTFIRRDFGISVSSFYTSMWWPAVLSWEEKYGILHTGVMIEAYSDDVEEPFEINSGVSQFLYYGNILLNHGGEIGYHGYNHQPLCLEGEDDSMQYGSYRLWPKQTDMNSAVSELRRFGTSLFPKQTLAVYVPPSNILSENGKQALVDNIPELRVIASTYTGSDEVDACVQEFEIEENGIIDTPRITSGYDVDYYQKLLALSEFNFQFVQNHFMHPDDVLDADRGADLGWVELRNRFEKYLTWVKDSVPMIRNQTGSELGNAVRDYCMLNVERSYGEKEISARLGGFSGESYFLCRANGGTPIPAGNCELTHVTGDLYLVHVLGDSFTIRMADPE